MNILYIEQSIPPYLGGIERVTWTNAQSLKKAGHDVFFAYNLHDYDEVDKEHKIKLDYSVREEIFIQFLFVFIVKNEIDIIINQDIYNKKLRKTFEVLKSHSICKIINCFHLSPDFLDYSCDNQKTIKHKLKDFFLKLLEGLDAYSYDIKSMYNVVDAFVLLSESFKDSFSKRYKLKDLNKLYTIGNPLSFDRFFQLDEISLKKRKVLIVTRFFEKQKNICSALRIWGEIEKDGYSEWELVIAGYGQDEKRIKDYAKALQIKRVKFMGKVLDPQKLYEEASIFMMTSKYEGFGMTLTEASQFGCVPVAFDNFSVLHDILTNEENGFIIPSDDEKKFKEVLEELMDNSNMRYKVANRAISNSKRFAVDKICEQWLVLIKKLQS